jgi:hypothetical protein
VDLLGGLLQLQQVFAARQSRQVPVKNQQQPASGSVFQTDVVSIVIAGCEHGDGPKPR